MASQGYAGMNTVSLHDKTQLDYNVCPNTTIITFYDAHVHKEEYLMFLGYVFVETEQKSNAFRERSGSVIRMRLRWAVFKS